MLISDSDVFQSVEVPSRPMQNQNVNVNAYSDVYYNKICMKSGPKKRFSCPSRQVLVSFVRVQYRSARAGQTLKQESRAVARKPRDAAAVLFGLKFVDKIRYKFKSSQALFVFTAHCNEVP